MSTNDESDETNERISDEEMELMVKHNAEDLIKKFYEGQELAEKVLKLAIDGGYTPLHLISAALIIDLIQRRENPLFKDVRDMMIRTIVKAEAEGAFEFSPLNGTSINPETMQ